MGQQGNVLAFWGGSFCYVDPKFKFISGLPPNACFQAQNVLNFIERTCTMPPNRLPRFIEEAPRKDTAGFRISAFCRLNPPEKH